MNNIHSSNNNSSNNNNVPANQLQNSHHHQTNISNRQIQKLTNNEPIGVKFIESVLKHEDNCAKRNFYKFFVLFITFITYACFHMGRRPLSIVKNVLNRNCSELINISNYESSYETLIEPFTYNINELETSLSPIPTNFKKDTSCDWPPFDNDQTANRLLALLDSAFLFSYAAFMFFSGFLADRCNLRYFLTAGLLGSGFLLYAFGLAFYLNIHSMTYFLVVQILSGAFQTTGWPTVVTCVGNWFGPSSRGLIFGLWNSHTNIGNILGATISGYFVQTHWGLSFIVPGCIMLLSAVIVFLFLVPKPEDVKLPPTKENTLNGSRLTLDESGLTSNCDYSTPQPTRRKIHKTQQYEENNYDCDSIANIDSEQQLLISQDNNEDIVAYHQPVQAVSFKTCLKIPGVLEFSLCLFFSKLVSYTFLYWLPRFITQSTLNNSENSAYLSTPFDLGGIVGAISAGYLSDRYKTSGIICSIMLFCAIPAMFLYEKYAAISDLHNILLQLVAGALVNGPYALITTVVSADLGSRVKCGKAMASVAAIIDGTGSVGAALGPLFAGFVSDSGWTAVFIMCMVSDLLASLCLIRIISKEIKTKFHGSAQTD